MDCLNTLRSLCCYTCTLASKLCNFSFNWGWFRFIFVFPAPLYCPRSYYSSLKVVKSHAYFSWNTTVLLQRYVVFYLDKSIYLVFFKAKKVNLPCYLLVTIGAHRRGMSTRRYYYVRIASMLQEKETSRLNFIELTVEKYYRSLLL